MTSSSPSIVLFQSDLRLADNPALSAAVKREEPLLCLYIWNPEATGYAMPGAASRWWLHYSLESLSRNLDAAGSKLFISIGNTLSLLSELLKTFTQAQVFWNRSCEPTIRHSEAQLLNLFASKQVQGFSFYGNHLTAPSEIHTQARNPYRVFTPFWKQLQSSLTLPPSLPAPKKLPPPPTTTFTFDSLASLQLLPTIDWAKGIRETWRPGEAGAGLALKKFLRNPASQYSTDRDRPDLPHTSRLSPHLRFGEISPKQIWHAVQGAKRQSHSIEERKSHEAYLRQIVWREFANHLLYHFPNTVDEPMNDEYRHFPWQEQSKFLRQWQKGLTGYPIVDAGMRELWQTGWMHNRVRMITGSFLTKDLLIPWQKGATWFWDTLVDADLANNTLGWQWVAGCGADASPFFRIFNPVTQGIKFDPDGHYVRRWIPELSRLHPPWIHKPWETPPLLLAEAHVILGETYPYPIIDHQTARKQALERYHALKNASHTAAHSIPEAR